MSIKFENKLSINSLQRKFNKLKRDPDLFVKDLIFNKKEQLQKTVNKIRPVKAISKNKFTIVSACYNVEKYLDDYFESIVNQSVSFKESIYIICVDDGSSDNSAKIIKKWQKKYPNNITYIYKENGGQSSARNLGLDYVNTTWVTMIDPDDFLHVNFFEEIDKELNKNKNLKLVAPNFIFYFEDQKIKKDSHPLKYRFNKTNTTVCKNLESNIHLHAASSVFDCNLIKKNKLKFNIDVKPSFEDGKFIADYLLLCPNDKVVFLKSAIYYYRKRSDSSSTLDMAWKKPEKFYNTLKYGYLDMLITYRKKMGVIPQYIQRTVIYDTYWFVKNLENKEGETNFLTEKQKNEFHELLKSIYSLLDYENIIGFNMSGIWFKHKVGMLGLFKNCKPKFQICYIDNIDTSKKQICISYFSYGECDSNIKINGLDIIPSYHKKTDTIFVGEYFLTEYRSWVNYSDLSDELSVSLDNHNSKISVLGEQYSNSIKVDKILEKFMPSLKYDTDDSWIFIDRDSQADDNAEHLYRFILNNNLKKDFYFALNRNSQDWDRLEDEGFDLIEFGSYDFEIKLKKCSKIISSNIDHYIDNYFGDNYEYSKKIVFLQHGVIKDDLSNWLNTKKNLQCFITSTQAEYNSIVGDSSTYKFGKKEVVLTGLPRHDYLIKSKDKSEKTILIMPTWRSQIVGKTIGLTNERNINDDFLTSDFYENWKKIIHSHTLKKLVNTHGYKVIFAPHVNISMYIDHFDIPNYINIWNKMNTEESIQSLFVKSEILITDYSSVAFEMAYLEKPVIYYQFDKDTIFSGNHTYQKGYFEYEKDGFGPVVEEVEEVEQALDQILQNDGKALEPYLTRMQETFKFKDGRCCERVYDAIVALDHEDKLENLDLTFSFLNQAYEFENYQLVRERAENILLNHELSENDKQAIYAKLTESYVKLNAWDALELLLTEYDNEHYSILLLANQSKWEEVLNIIGYDLIADKYYALRISCLFNLNQLDVNILDQLQSNELNLSQYEIDLSLCYVHYLNERWDSLVASLENIQSWIEQKDMLIEFYTQDDLALMQIMVGKNSDTKNLNVIKKLDSKKPHFILQKSFVLNQLNSVDEALKGFSLAEQDKGLSYFELDILKSYISALFAKKNWTGLTDKIPQCIESHPNEIIFKEYFIQALGTQDKWKDLVHFYNDNALVYSNHIIYFIVLAHYRLGEIEQAYSLLIKPTAEYDYEYWLLALEIYMQMDDAQKSNDCLRRMCAIFPEKIKLTKEKFQTLSDIFS